MIFRQFLRCYSSKKNSNNNNNNNNSNKLLKELCQRIRFSGPITIAQYMSEVLTNPISGFYVGDSKPEILGPTGDFTTSPEISQMFGECIGIWIFNEWNKMGGPKPLQLVELGPGKGTLMKDVLSTIDAFTNKEFRNFVSVHLVELSPKLQNVQNACLKDNNVPVTWHSSLDQVPEQFSFYLAHEFFDALPIHRLERTDNGWIEVLIDVIDANRDELRYVRSRNRTPACVFADFEKTERNSLEVCPKAAAIIGDMSRRISSYGGGALIVDYGHDGTEGDTFRAFRGHRPHDPLLDPGTADLTADVDFSYLRRHCSDLTVTYGPTEQSDALKGLGIDLRLERILSQHANDEMIRKEVIKQHETLTSKDHMGRRFKFFAILPKTMQDIYRRYPPLGFS